HYQPIYHRWLAAWLESLRQAVSPRAFKSAWGQGEALSLEQAIVYALSDDEASFARTVRTSPASSAPHTSPLTPREQEIAIRLARGRTNKDIALELVLATSTVERHVANILNKLALGSRTEVALWVAQTESGVVPRDTF